MEHVEPGPVCGGDKQSPSEAITSYIQSVSERVAQILDPCTEQPLQIPHFDAMLHAAKNLDCVEKPADIASVITTFLGRGSSYDMKEIPVGYEMQFPKDHHIHPDIGGMEFYILAANLKAFDVHGQTRDIGISMWMQKNRVVGKTVQVDARWSDDESLVGSCMATAVLAPLRDPKKPKKPCITSCHAEGSAKGAPAQRSKEGEDLVFECEKNLGGRKVRRSRLLQWSLLGQNFEYSKPGEPFRFCCGPDSFQGSENVLPLRAQVKDGTNLEFDLTVDCLDELNPTNAFFLQGPAGPAGFQVNWPQLKVSGTLIIEGEQYEIIEGTGTVVHQAMPTTLENPNGDTHPIPYLEDPKPFIGWSWQWLNLDNNDAIIFAGVTINNLSINLMPFGVYARLEKDKGWVPSPIPVATSPTATPASSIVLGDFHPNPTVSSQTGTQRPSTIMPTTWKYYVASDTDQPYLDGYASAWGEDGSFNINDWSLFSELPVTYHDTSGKLPSGTGFCESFGFESTVQYYDRCVQYLRTGVVPE